MMVNEPAPELEYVSDAEWQTARRWLALLRELAHKQDRTLCSFSDFWTKC
jgi:hypothetical protein